LCTRAECTNNRCVFPQTSCTNPDQFCCPLTGTCGYCCSDCDCGGIFASEAEAPIPPPCARCISGVCQLSTLCGC
jgi:hypothetical protein